MLVNHGPSQQSSTKNTSHGNEVPPQDTTHLIHYHVSNEEVRAKIRQAIGSHENLLTIVKRRRLWWYGHVSRSSGLAKTILQGTVKGGRRQGRQRKRCEDNIREWTSLEFGRSKRAVEDRGKWRKMVAKSCGASTTLAVKGYRMMMTMIMNLFKLVKSSTGLKAQTTHHTLLVARNRPKYTTGNLHKLHV